MQGIEFTSRLPRHKRHALERILFFNGCQDRFARGIVDVIDRYGPPEIVDDGEGLRVRVGKGLSRPRFIAMTDPRAGNATTPIQYLMLYGEFGVGVGDRTNGTP